jgi:hypothetical protein
MSSSALERTALSIRSGGVCDVLGAEPVVVLGGLRQYCDATATLLCYYYDFTASLLRTYCELLRTTAKRLIWKSFAPEIAGWIIFRLPNPFNHLVKFLEIFLHGSIGETERCRDLAYTSGLMRVEVLEDFPLCLG